MAYYINTNSASAIAAVEFTPRPEGNFSFFYARSAEQLSSLKTTLEALGQKVLSEAKLDGKPVLVTSGNKTQEELTQACAARGDKFTLPPPKHKFQPWKWRGHFSDIGQGLNLASSKLSGKTLDAPKLMFAGLNLSANWVNKNYGAQKKEDLHHLRILKKQINANLHPYLPLGAQLPDVDDHRADLREEPSRPQTIGQKFHSFMRENSVRVGEIGLRYLGSLAMVLSITQFTDLGRVREGTKIIEKFKWSRVWESLKKGSPRNAYGVLNTNKTNLWTGLIYLAGKTLGLIFAKTPDPFNPEPKTAFETFREKYAFRISSVIETGAAATLAIGSFRKRDWIGSVAGTSLVAGLLTRVFAPFGVRKVPMSELYAHVIDSLAVMPPDKLPQLLATTAAGLKKSFKDDPETFGQIFMTIKDKLYHERGIAINADLNAKSPGAALQPDAGQLARKMPQPAASYAEQVTQAPQPSMGIS